jgi:hypothetical protein
VGSIGGRACVCVHPTLGVATPQHVVERGSSRVCVTSIDRPARNRSRLHVGAVTVTASASVRDAPPRWVCVDWRARRRSVFRCVEGCGESMSEQATDGRCAAVKRPSSVGKSQRRTAVAFETNASAGESRQSRELKKCESERSRSRSLRVRLSIIAALARQRCGATANDSGRYRLQIEHCRPAEELGGEDSTLAAGCYCCCCCWAAQRSFHGTMAQPRCALVVTVVEPELFAFVPRITSN